MQHIIEYLVQSNSTTTLLMIAITICVGTIIGKVKIMSLRIGVIAVLFSGMILGIVCGRLGIGLNADMTGILKDLGLILFIYIIGLQVGPSFFAGLKKGGLRLNLQAFVIVVLGLVITLLISEFDGVQPDMMAGIYSGAISSTPGLSAAQETVRDLGAGDAEAVAAGYALAYPIGVIIPIVCCILIRRICNVRLEDENFNEIIGKASDAKSSTEAASSVGKSVIVLFGGILLGLLVGSIAIYITIKGTTVPMKLGYTGGTLVTAILIGHFGTKWGWIDSTITNSEGYSLLKEVGLVIFMALVGLTSGSKILEINILSGAKWIIYGLIIALLPTLIVGLFVRMRHKTNYFTLMGLIGGATTDTPALAYANNVATKRAEGLPAEAYATVYPLTVFLRILTAQFFVLIML